MVKKQSKKVAKDVYIQRIPQDLIDRAKKKIGMSDEMINSFPDAESLKRYCDGIHPKSNPDARMKEGEQPERKNFEDNMPDTFTLESVLNAEYFHGNREQFDRNNLQEFLRSINRKYGVQKPVRIVKDENFVAKKYELLTNFTIYFK